MNTVTLNLNPIIKLTPDQFYQLCAANPDLQLERNAEGELIVMPPTVGETGKRNSSINAQLWLWNQKTQLGEFFDSSTGFTLPNKNKRDRFSFIYQLKHPLRRHNHTPLYHNFFRSKICNIFLRIHHLQTSFPPLYSHQAIYCTLYR